MNFNTLFRIRRLEALFKQLYCEVKNNPDSGSGSPNDTGLLYTSDENYNVVLDSSITMLTLDGNSTNIYLPPISQNKGKILVIFNDSNSPSTIFADPTDLNGIWEGGMNMNSINIDPNSGRNIMNNGIQYKTLN